MYKFHFRIDVLFCGLKKKQTPSSLAFWYGILTHQSGWNVVFYHTAFILCKPFHGLFVCRGSGSLSIIDCCLNDLLYSFLFIFLRSLLILLGTAVGGIL